MDRDASIFYIISCLKIILFTLLFYLKWSYLAPSCPLQFQPLHYQTCWRITYTFCLHFLTSQSPINPYQSGIFPTIHSKTFAKVTNTLQETNLVEGVLPSSLPPPGSTRQSCSFSTTWDIVSWILWPLYFQFSLYHHQLLFPSFSFARLLSTVVTKNVVLGPLYSLFIDTYSDIYVYACVT